MATSEHPLDRVDRETIDSLFTCIQCFDAYPSTPVIICDTGHMTCAKCTVGWNIIQAPMPTYPHMEPIIRLVDIAGTEIHKNKENLYKYCAFCQKPAHLLPMMDHILNKTARTCTCGRMFENRNTTRSLALHQQECKTTFIQTMEDRWHAATAELLNIINIAEIRLRHIHARQEATDQITTLIWKAKAYTTSQSIPIPKMDRATYAEKEHRMQTALDIKHELGMRISYIACGICSRHFGTCLIGGVTPPYCETSPQNINAFCGRTLNRPTQTAEELITYLIHLQDHNREGYLDLATEIKSCATIAINLLNHITEKMHKNQADRNHTEGTIFAHIVTMQEAQYEILKIKQTAETTTPRKKITLEVIGPLNPQQDTAMNTSLSLIHTMRARQELTNPQIITIEDEEEIRIIEDQQQQETEQMIRQQFSPESNLSIPLYVQDPSLEEELEIQEMDVSLTQREIEANISVHGLPCNMPQDAHPLTHPSITLSLNNNEVTHTSQLLRHDESIINQHPRTELTSNTQPPTQDISTLRPAQEETDSWQCLATSHLYNDEPIPTLPNEPSLSYNSQQTNTYPLTSTPPNEGGVPVPDDDEGSERHQNTSIPIQSTEHSGNAITATLHPNHNETDQSHHNYTRCNTAQPEYEIQQGQQHEANEPAGPTAHQGNNGTRQNHPNDPRPGETQQDFEQRLEKALADFLKAI